MCMARAYLKQGVHKEILLEEVAFIRTEGEELLLKTLFGEEKSLRATIREIDFANSMILLEGEVIHGEDRG